MVSPLVRIGLGLRLVSELVVRLISSVIAVLLDEGGLVLQVVS
jgi:hypothetical protein